MTTAEIREFLNELRKRRGALAAFAISSGVKSNTLLKIATNKIGEPGHTIAQKIIESAAIEVNASDKSGASNA